MELHVVKSCFFLWTKFDCGIHRGDRGDTVHGSRSYYVLITRRILFTSAAPITFWRMCGLFHWFLSKYALVIRNIFC